MKRGRNHPILTAAFACLLSVGRAAAQNADLSFSHGSAFHESPFRLTISTPHQGAMIYYTTNGNAPTPAAELRYDDGVPIATRTIVRAAAFINKRAINEAAKTYLFIPAILRQTGGKLPEVWGTSAGLLIPGHYEMSVASNEDAALQNLSEALRAIPSLFLITEPDNLFSPESGIYLHPMERGVEWERLVNAEMLDVQGRTVFQVNCGLRIHGGMSRRPEESPKHSFRLAFKRRYGPAKLRVPLFGPDGAQEFDHLVLRAGSNDSWLDSNGTHRGHASYIRDEWMRRSMRDMGHPTARGFFVHLYLNGLYWGLYNLCERPGPQLLPAGENAAQLKFDFRKADEIESGDAVAWDKMMARANAGLADAGRYQEIRQYLDLSEFVDYLILNFYAGNSDWDRSANWCAIRPRIPGGKFQFLVWDAERILKDREMNTVDLDDDESPMRLFHKLSENAAFRSFFAERARRLLLDSGPLSPEAAATRFRTLADSIARALPAEAARWGNYREHVHRFKSGPFETCTPDQHWRPEVNRILTDFFPHRGEILLDQFRERGLLPPATVLPDN